jgi:hypothetical protein
METARLNRKKRKFQKGATPKCPVIFNLAIMYDEERSRSLKMGAAFFILGY